MRWISRWNREDECNDSACPCTSAGHHGGIMAAICFGSWRWCQFYIMKQWKMKNWECEICCRNSYLKHGTPPVFLILKRSCSYARSLHWNYWLCIEVGDSHTFPVGTNGHVGADIWMSIHCTCFVFFVWCVCGYVWGCPQKGFTPTDVKCCKINLPQMFFCSFVVNAPGRSGNFISFSA